MHNHGPRNLEIIPTPVLRKSEKCTSQILRLHWDNLSEPVRITARPVGMNALQGEPVRIDPDVQSRADSLVGVPLPDEIMPGDSYTVRIQLKYQTSEDEIQIECVRPRDDWTLFIGAGYHVDPVWWNTQRDYTETGSRQGDGVNTFLELNQRFLELAGSDPDFACTIETVPALHPTWLSNPELREHIRSRLHDGTLEIIASYDQPQSTLVGCELLIRNIAYGIGFASLITGTIRPGLRPGYGLAQWDAFGHDPVWPALGRAFGIKWNTFCRGLYHGEHLAPEENLFVSEFRWISPDSSELLTHYMSRHYTSGWEFSWASMVEGEIPVLDRFRQLATTASTRNVLLPCYGDFAEPFPGMMEFVREWNYKYLSPKIQVGTQDDYIASVTESCEHEKIWLPPISRDFNPAYAGCNLSYQDTKLAQRLGERYAREAEILAAYANLLGAVYPTAALDRAWRILCYCAHHDAITGSESDQVYLDLISLWREACDIGRTISESARDKIAMQTQTPDGPCAYAVTVFNSLGWKFSGNVILDTEGHTQDAHVTEGHAQDAHVTVDADGNETPLISRDGHLEFTVVDVPPLGWKNYRICRQDASGTAGRIPALPPTDQDSIGNDRFIVKVDPAMGEGITSIVNKESGKEFIRDKCVANNIVVYPEYPGMNMAPWIIQPTGERGC